MRRQWMEPISKFTGKNIQKINLGKQPKKATKKGTENPLGEALGIDTVGSH